MEIKNSFITICEKTLPEAWEKAVLECWSKGLEIKTQYDKLGDPPSRDVTAMIVVEDPMAEPRIHRAIPAGLEELEIYKQEVVNGVHDHWVTGGKWNYGYHSRLFDYNPEYFGSGVVNQIQTIIKLLAETPHTRRAQAITWRPEIDRNDEHAPCLQRLWLRIFDKQLFMNVDMRSNDAYKAAFMNMYAFTELQAYVAREVSLLRGEEIKVGRYIHYADSFHIYGSYFNEFKGFVDLCSNTEIKDRVYLTSDVQYFLDNGKVKLYLNSQCPSIPLPMEQAIRLYNEIPEDRREEINQKFIRRLNESGK